MITRENGTTPLKENINTPKSRQSQNNITYLENKAKVVADKLKNPNLTTRELEAKHKVSRTTVAREIKTELRDIKDKNPQIINNAVSFITKYQKKILGTDLDINSHSDMLSLTTAMKNQMALVSMLEGVNSGNDTNLPANINIQIVNK